jgi:DNA-binding response OmpR family regulator
MDTRILVCESDGDLRHLIVTTLQRRGYIVEGHADGHDALDVIARSEPDLVLLDIDLPEPNGLTISHSLKRDPATAQLPIIMLIGKEHEIETHTWLRTGVHGLLIKPFAPHDLVARVDQMIEAVMANREQK